MNLYGKSFQFNIFPKIKVQDANYAGDSYINIIFDVIVFIVGYVFVVWTSWYGAPIWYVVSELFQLWYFRNSLTMITITVLKKNF